MTIRDLLIKGEKEIEYIECKLLLAYLLDCDENYITVNANKKVSPNIEKQYFKSIKKVLNGTPLQYITHKQPFYKRDFYVNSNVLIPQPDTEVLVSKAIELMSKSDKNYFKILDLCTGSGNIAISVALELEELKKSSSIYASDISLKALNVAKTNQNRLMGECRNNKLYLIKSDLFEYFEEKNIKFDYILSNPPYIKKNEIRRLPSDVKHEPMLALNGGIDGLDFYRKIKEQYKKYLNDDGYILLEIGYDQKDKVMELFEDSICVKDLNQQDRLIISG